MNPSLKPLSKQVVVVTGASSGIGLATARMAARRGARVVLSSRNHRDLPRIVQQIRREGGEAVYHCADVTDPDAMTSLAEVAVQRYGRIDTWINNAGVGLFGKLTDVKLLDKRRLFDVNFWGVVHGCRAAVKRMRERGGVIINVGSAESDRAIPVQGIYGASKQAVKAYTDALRMELEMERAPIRVSLVKPASIDTPFVSHAKNLMSEFPRQPRPIYAPEVAARAILSCAIRPQRDLYVGSAALVLSWLETFAPRLTDRLMERSMLRAQLSGRPHSEENAIDGVPRVEGMEAGSALGHIRKRSFSAEVVSRLGQSMVNGMVLAALTATIAFVAKSWRSTRAREEYGRVLGGIAGRGTPDGAEIQNLARHRFERVQAAARRAA